MFKIWRDRSTQRHLCPIKCKKKQFKDISGSFLASLILPRDAMHSTDYAAAIYLSVRLPVRLSHAGILSKRLNMSSNFFSLRRAATPF